MTDRKLAILAVTAVIMAGWAVLQNRLSHRADTTASMVRTPLIQGLDPQAVAKISITSDKGKSTVTLTRVNDRFTVAEMDGYPADISAVNRLLSNCLDIRTAEHITSNPENHAGLGVTEETAQYVVRFFNADGDEITGIIVSETPPDREEGAFARLTTSDETYFIQDPPWLSTTASAYVNTTLIEADSAKIRRVAVRGPEGEYVLKLADDEQTIMLEKMPENKQFKGTAYRSVFRALTSLRFEEAIAAENAPQDLVFDRSYICRLDDSTVYTLKLAKQGDKTYATVTADFLDKAPVQISKEESEEELKKKEAKLLAMDAAEAFAQRHKGWVYTISSWKAADLTKPLEELLEPKPEEKAPAETEPEPDAEAPAEVNAEGQNLPAAL
jgi:hypothetical protein